MADKKPSSPRRGGNFTLGMNYKTMHSRRTGIIPESQMRRVMSGKPGNSVEYGPEKYDKYGISPTAVKWSDTKGRYIEVPTTSNKQVLEKLSQAGKAKQARHFNSQIGVAYRQRVRIPESARPPRMKVSGSSVYPPQRPIPGSISEFRRMSGTPRMRSAIGRGVGSMAAMMGAKAAGDYIATTPLGRAIRRSLVK